MIRYVVRRLPSLVVVLFGSSLLIFAILRLIPGNPAATLAGTDATPADVEAIKRQLGLNRPLPSQYVHWLGQVVQLHLGRSYIIGGDVSTLVSHGAGNTILLTVSALIIAVVLSAILGPVWASSRRPWVDHLLTGSNTLLVALPTFVTGVLLLLVFGVELRVLPAGGVPPNGFLANPVDTLKFVIMPAFCLALPVVGILSRYLAESLRTELHQPYVATALSAGVSRRRIITRHALRNVLPTSLTVLGIQIGALLGGAIIVEYIFSWPGLGQLIQQAITDRDYPVVQALLLLAVVVFVLTQLLTDVAHAALDPRIRLGGTE